MERDKDSDLPPSGGDMVEKTIAKFTVGQIVVFKNLKGEPPFRILDAHWEDGWFYQWNRKNSAHEGMLRELTKEEKGELKEGEDLGAR